MPGCTAAPPRSRCRHARGRIGPGRGVPGSAALPQSRDANRYLLRILVALNRIGESAAPLVRWPTPTRDRIANIGPTAAVCAASDKALAARVVRQALEDALVIQPEAGRLEYHRAHVFRRG